jgi:hypothetical protein
MRLGQGYSGDSVQHVRVVFVVFNASRTDRLEIRGLTSDRGRLQGGGWTVDLDHKPLPAAIDPRLSGNVIVQIEGAALAQLPHLRRIAILLSSGGQVAVSENDLRGLVEYAKTPDAF